MWKIAKVPNKLGDLVKTSIQGVGGVTWFLLAGHI